MPIVDVQRVSKRFRPVIAVAKVSFNVNRGALSGLLDPKGAGKTFIIQLMPDIFTGMHIEITMPTLDEIFPPVFQESAKNQ